MLASIVLMFAMTSVVIIMYMVLHTNVTPVLVGQRWRMPGVGIIRIARVLGTGAMFGEDIGADVNVMFRLPSGQFGFCRKTEIRSAGRLLPVTVARSPAERLEDEIQVQIEIDKIVSQMRGKPKKSSKVREDEFKPYSPPPGWTGRVYDAEIIRDAPTPRGPREFKFLTFDGKSRS